MTAGRSKDGRGFRARHGVRPDINAVVLILFLVASPAAATSADCCISSSRDRLSAPFAEDGIRRPLSANVKCRQIERAANDSVTRKGKSWSESSECVTRSLLSSILAAPWSCFLINYEDSDKLLFPTLK